MDDTINVKNIDLNKIKIDKKSYKNILIYCIGYVTVKDLRYMKINSVNFSYLIIQEINGYIKENNGNKYLTLVPTDKRKDTLKAITTQLIIMKKFSKSYLIQMMNYS